MRYFLVLIILVLPLSGQTVNPYIFHDPDALDYFTRASVTDTTSQYRITRFVRELKAAGIWTSATDFWLFRSGQNAGSGTTVHALKSSSNNGTLVNGPAWGANGLVVSGITQAMNTSIVQTMNHDLTSGGVVTLVTVPANARLWGAVGATAQPTILFFSGGTASTMAMYDGGGAVGSGGGNFATIGSGTLAYTPGTLTGYFNGVAGATGSATWSASSHTLALGNSGGESISSGTIHVAYLWATTKLTSSQVAALHTALKVSVCSGLGLP